MWCAILLLIGCTKQFLFTIHFVLWLKWLTFFSRENTFSWGKEKKKERRKGLANWKWNTYYLKDELRAIIWSAKTIKTVDRSSKNMFWLKYLGPRIIIHRIRSAWKIKSASRVQTKSNLLINLFFFCHSPRSFYDCKKEHKSEMIIKDKFTPIFDLVSRVFTNGLGDQGSIPGRVIPKTLKMVLDTSLLNTQQYKVCIKG